MFPFKWPMVPLGKYIVFFVPKTYCKLPTSNGSTSLGPQRKLVKLSLCENLKHSSLDPKVGTQLGIEKCYLNCWQHFLKQMSPRSNQDYQDWYAGKFHHYKTSKISEIKCFQPMEPNKNNTNSMLPTFISFAHVLLNQTRGENSCPTHDARIAQQEPPGCLKIYIDFSDRFQKLNLHLQICDFLGRVWHPKGEGSL